MQVSAVSSATANSFQRTELSTTQKGKLDSILEKYDSKNFTQQDFESLSNDLRQAGFRPNAEIKKALENKGINPDSYQVKGSSVSPGQGVDSKQPNGWNSRTSFLSSKDWTSLLDEISKSKSTKEVTSGLIVDLES